MKNNDYLVETVRKKAIYYLDNQNRDERIINAMYRVDRANFLPFSMKDQAYEDIPLPIGHGQTCSQPSMVAFMLDQLEIQEDNKILEIGGGCGYAAAIASLLCRKGMIYTSEIISELADTMQHNLAAFLENIVILKEDGSSGFQKVAPFDRIFLSAGVSSYFDHQILLDQLTDNGILLYPEKYGNLYKLIKRKNHIHEKIFYGVSFVPLKGKNS
ncbi:MAG: protein-L-isoaspartate O-methyltransferase [Spirochaetes bacterium]|nr:protein-L-isoaspartate O-methyltransferase [Spirochaetota bacterium]